MKDTKPQIQDSWRTPSRINFLKSHLGNHIQITEYQRQKIFKEAMEGEQNNLPISKTRIRITSNFSSQTMQAIRE